MTLAEWKELCRLKSKLVSQKKQEQGQLHGTAPFGYRWIRCGSRRKGSSLIELDPIASAAITEMYERYAQGIYSLDAVGEYILQKYPDFFKTGQVKGGQIHRILTNPFYIGKVERKDGSFYDHYYPTFISKELFDSVQNKLKERSKSKRKTSKNNFGLFRSLLQCGQCECRITIERHKGHIYYRCTQSKGKHNAPTINETQLKINLFIACKENSIQDKIFSSLF